MTKQVEWNIPFYERINDIRMFEGNLMSRSTSTGPKVWRSQADFLKEIAIDNTNDTIAKTAIGALFLAQGNKQTDPRASQIAAKALGEIGLCDKPERAERAIYWLLDNANAAQEERGGQAYAQAELEKLRKARPMVCRSIEEQIAKGRCMKKVNKPRSSTKPRK